MSSGAAFDAWVQRGCFAAALVCAIVAAALRWLPIHESLWVDELHTAWCSVGSLDEVASRAAMGNQSPLFACIEWLMVRVIGPSELSLRLTSLVAGSLLPLAVYWLSMRWSSRGVGLVAAVLITVDPLAIFYATEARPYALVQLLAVTHMAIAAELVYRPTVLLRALWIVGAAVLFHLHYTAALLIPAELTFFALMLLVAPRDIRLRWPVLLLDTSILLLLCLPALGNLTFIFSRRAYWTSFVEQQPLWTVFDWWPWALGGWYVAMALIIYRLIPEPPHAETAPTRHAIFPLMVLCWLLVPALIAWTATHTDVARLFYRRYLLGCFPAATLLTALCVGLAPWRWSRAVLGVLVVGLGIWSSGIIERLGDDGTVIQPRGEDWRGCAAWLNEQLSLRPYPVLLASGLIEAQELAQPHNELLDEYCLFTLTSLYSLDADRSELFPISGQQLLPLPQVAEMLIVHRGGAWVVVRGDERAGRALAAAIVAHLQRATVVESNIAWRTDEARSFGRVQVLRLAAEPPSQPESLR